MIRLLAVLCLSAGAACAEGIAQVDYATLADTLNGRFDFEQYEPRPEPGFSVEGLLSNETLRLGEAFAGQTVGGALFDTVTGPVAPYPTALPGPTGRNHALAFHAGFGSVTLFPLGPYGFPGRSARGEGSLAIGFAQPVDRFGLRIHADYPDPLGSRPAPGEVTLRFYAPTGDLIATHIVQLDHGVTDLGFAGAGIAGVLITSTDPGGIAIDDLIYPLRDMSS